MNKMETENKPCPSCGAYNGEHNPRCSLITFEAAKKHLETYYQLWVDREKIRNEKMILYQSWARKAQQRAELWEGKYRTVKTENNALRRKIGKGSKMGLKEHLEQLYKECEHGDEQHRKWLKDKFEEYYSYVQKLWLG